MSKQDITELVAGLPVVAGPLSDEVPVYEPDDFRRTVDSADTPARIILPSTEGDEHRGVPLGIGNTTRMEWTVKDLLLYRPVEEGLGWLDVGYDLDGYVDSYVAQLNAYNHSTATGGFCTEQAEVLEYNFQVGTHTFSNRTYYGVMVTLRIMQIVQ